MKREEQIKEASIDFQIATHPRCIAGGAFADYAREMNVNQSFIEGAKWADKTMIERACKWLKDDMLNQYAFQGRLERLKIIDGIIERFRKAMEE